MTRSLDGDRLHRMLHGFVDDFELAKKLYDQVPQEKREDLGRKVAAATDDDSDYCFSEIIGMLARLSVDPWWEPDERTTTNKNASPSLHLWDQECQSKEKYIDEALKMMGNRDAMSLTLHAILDDARHYWLMDIRNAVRQWMLENNLITAEDPLQ